jgi:hypothetical protein
LQPNSLESITGEFQSLVIKKFINRKLDIFLDLGDIFQSILVAVHRFKGSKVQRFRGSGNVFLFVNCLYVGTRCFKKLRGNGSDSQITLNLEP